MQRTKEVRKKANAIIFNKYVKWNSYQYGDVDTLLVTEGLNANWGWAPNRVTHVLPQGIIAIQSPANREH